MGEVVNLRMARKARARTERETLAAANRVEHGLPKAERERLAAERLSQSRKIEGHLRDRPDPDR